MRDKNQDTLSPAKYASFLQTIRKRITQSRMLAYRTVNRELIDLYWDIGKEIAGRQDREGWGKSVVERLAKDLQKEFVGEAGFSAPNLWFMRQLFMEYREAPNLLQLVREIPWGQNIAVMTKIKDPDAREYYLRMTAEMGWSRNVLHQQISTDAYSRQKKAAKQHNMEVEYALKGIDKPVGVAKYSLTRRLPPALKEKLPDPRKLEKQIMRELGDIND